MIQSGLQGDLQELPLQYTLKNQASLNPVMCMSQCDEAIIYKNANTANVIK